jgi:hypothetical protein
MKFNWKFWKNLLRKPAPAEEFRESSVFGELSEEWHDFFLLSFGVRFPFSRVKIPENPSPSKLDRILFDPGANLLPYKNLLAGAKRIVPVEFQPGFSEESIISEEEWRGFADPRVIRCENIAEANQSEWKDDLAAKSIRRKMIRTLALRQMIIFHLKWFKEGDGCLDQTCKTRCSWSMVGKDKVATIQSVDSKLLIGTSFLDDCFPLCLDRLAYFD